MAPNLQSLFQIRQTSAVSLSRTTNPALAMLGRQDPESAAARLATGAGAQRLSHRTPENLERKSQ
jgi:hypothetical protein